MAYEQLTLEQGHSVLGIEHGPLRDHALQRQGLNGAAPDEPGRKKPRPAAVDVAAFGVISEGPIRSAQVKSGSDLSTNSGQFEWVKCYVTRS